MGNAICSIGLGVRSKEIVSDVQSYFLLDLKRQHQHRYPLEKVEAVVENIRRCAS